MVSMPKINTARGVRRRVYVLGVICTVMAAVQSLAFFVMLGMVLNPEHKDVQVAVGSAVMASLTATYGFLTARLLFLIHENRSFEASGAEWLWWFCSLGVVLFNGLLLIWFFLLTDYIPAILCCLAIPIYTLFFYYAKDDIKLIKEYQECQRNEEQEKL